MKDIPAAKKWIVVMTKPRMESSAAKNLLLQEYEVYLPIWYENRRVNGRWKQVQSPMFPRYLFLTSRYDEQSFSSIRSTYGVSRLVKFGSEIAWVSDALVISIKKLETQQLLNSEKLPFTVGDKVEVLDGPFKGVCANVLSCKEQRVVLLLNLLGNDQYLNVDLNSLKHINM